jgi:hypothetical protein
MPRRRADKKTYPVVFGERFGRLIVTDIADDPAGHRSVRCDCGTELRVAASDLLAGSKRRCDKKGHPEVSAEERKFRKSYGACQYRARTTLGVEFDIPYEAYKVQTAWNCAYCGIKPANGLDQVVAAQGYHTGNLVPCCWTCNRAKSTMTQDEFIAWLKRIVENMHTSVWGSAHPVSKMLAEIDEKRRAGNLPIPIRMLEELDAKNK